MTRADMLRRLELSHPTVAPQVLASRFVHLTTAVGEDCFVWKYDPLHRTRGPFPFRESVFMRFAARVTAPVLFVSGGENGYRVSGEETRLTAFKNLSRLSLEGAGHMVHWTRPGELAAAILKHALEAGVTVDEP
jgi:pimeloyl-ACP methyl ester carboxylesterase